MTGAEKSLSYFLPCCVQHIFDEDAVAGGGVVHKDVGNSADKLSVLDDGRTGHALYDAAGGIQQAGICNPQEHIPALGGGGGIDFENFHRIFLG